MTALKKFARLECPGVWRPSPETRRQEVIVSFGDASLVISTSSGQPISHWSLAAVLRINRQDELPALYTPAADALETLELEDELMIDAIEEVRGAIMKARPRKGRLRMVLVTAFVACAIAAVAYWLPGALLRHTVSVVPEPVRAEIGTQIFRDIARIAGNPCRSTRGDQALAKLHARLLEPGKGGLMVLPGGIVSTVSLPGGLILLNRSLVEDYDSPDVAAGYILAEAVRRSETDPLAKLLRSLGTVATARLLTTGHLPAESLESYARMLATTPAAPVDDASLLKRFDQAGVSSTPYAYARDVTGQSTAQLIEQDPMRSGGARQLLQDGEWVSLQGICLN